jgi:TatD DNase family protein
MGNHDHSYPPSPAPLTLAVYDNHTHLDPGSSDTERVGTPMELHEHLERAVEAGVRGIVQVGTDLDSSTWSADAARGDARILAAVALHPNEAPRLTRQEFEDALAELDTLAGQPRVRAIGETGLDHFRTGEDGRARQSSSFAAHIDMAKQHGLALQIHDRDAHRDIVETLRRQGAPDRTVFHCFSGDVELAGICAAAGWYVSFAGNITFKNADGLRRAAQAVPASRLLVETDAPYLTPAPYRGRPNAPYLIPLTLRILADVRGVDVEGLAANIVRNTEAVYGRWDDEPAGAAS